MDKYDNAGRCYLHLRDRCDECGHAHGSEPVEPATTVEQADVLAEDFEVARSDASKKRKGKS